MIELQHAAEEDIRRQSPMRADRAQCVGSVGPVDIRPACRKRGPDRLVGVACNINVSEAARDLGVETGAAIAREERDQIRLIADETAGPVEAETCPRFLCGFGRVDLFGVLLNTDKARAFPVNRSREARGRAAAAIVCF
ncbi:hypothetical protein [Roseovarius pacificus]|uniref:hypothetical protein n=1 Tax=Roseovarius pacificus TaxID=337701 RepID=UPI004038FD5B